MLHKEIYLLENNCFKNRYSYLTNDISGRLVLFYNLLDSKEIHSIKWNKEDIVSIKWIKHHIFIQCRKKTYLFNPDKGKIYEYPSVGYIIYRILYIISILEFVCETIEGNIVFISFKKNVVNKIATLSNGKLTFNKSVNEIYEKKALNKIISMRPDRITGRKINIYHDRDKAYIYINNTKIIIWGYVEKVSLLQQDCIFLISSFNKPGALYNVNDLIQNHLYCDVTFRHRFINKIPVYDNFIKSQNIIFFIHGGPESNYMQFYDYTIAEINRLKLYRIVLINYSGSTGYSRKYQESIYKNGGQVDLESILKVIKNYRGRKIVIGESYGGYLATLLSIKNYDHNQIEKVIAINGFTDIYFQLFFSKSKNIITKYFPVRSPETISLVNPISLLKQGYYPNCKLVFIHSINDLICPIDQIYYFNNWFHQFTAKECKIISTTVSHQLLNLSEKKKITDILMDEIVKEK